MKKKINILYVIPQLNIGGAELQLLKLVSGINKKKYNLFLVNLEKNADYLRGDFEKQGVKVLNISKKGKYDLSIIFKLRYIIQEKKIDIIHSFLNNTWSRLACINLKNKPKVIIGERSIDDWWKKWYNFKLDKFLLRYTDYITCNSNEIKNYYKKKLNIEDRMFKVIYNGINIEEYIFNEIEISNSKKENGFNREIIFGIVASLRNIKDHMTLFKAVKKLKDNNIKNFKVLIIGDGHLREEYEKYVEENNIGDIVIFKGNIRPVSNILKCIDVGISTSIQEGLSNSIIEFGVSGKKVIATKVGGNIELISSEINGYFIDVGDYNNLAELMYEFIEKKIELDVNESFLTNYRSRFNLKKMISNYEKLYEEEKDVNN